MPSTKLHIKKYNLHWFRKYSANMQAWIKSKESGTCRYQTLHIYAKRVLPLPRPCSGIGGRGEPLKEATTYSPALRCSTIGAGGLNFSVRDGKRWNPAAIADIRHRNKTLGTNFRYGRTGKSRRAISSARLNGSHRVHLHPIDVIVYDDPVRSNLAAGFALRCIQRLSDPDLATLQCTWRHNRRTRGRSGTVLSY